MASDTVVETRLSALEREVEDLKRRLSSRADKQGWLSQVTGSLAGEPDFEEVLKLGKAARRGSSAGRGTTVIYMFVLDTDHIGIIQRGNTREFPRLWERMQQYPEAAFHVSIISFHEQVTGWNAYLARARDTAGVVRAYGMFQQILADFGRAQVLPFDKAAADLFDSYRAQKVRTGTVDLRIGAVARSRDFTLLTRNVSDFQRIPGLRVEDWAD